MSEKIIVLHPENQPEVDIYPIIKEGSIPNSVIDNQKIKSRTIINSNIALNTLKYEVLHQTLKDLIDSKITQANMENYLSSYYYNVEETQQYVGSEINTLHQTIQNEFYSNTTIDNMLMEKTDLSLFRQYLPSTYLNLDKQQDNQTSKLNIHANGSIFLMNSGNKTNSGNYYLPNSIVKTEDAPNGYFVLSTTNDDYQSLYNLGAYDKITTNDDGTYSIVRQTGYLTIKTEDITSGSTTSVNNSNAYTYVINKDTNAISNDEYSGETIGISSNGYSVRYFYQVWTEPENIGIDGKNKTITLGFSSVKTQAEIQALCPIHIQYKLATTTTEKVEKNHYSRYNQTFILDHNKSEAERSANLWNLEQTLNCRNTSNIDYEYLQLQAFNDETYVSNLGEFTWNSNSYLTFTKTSNYNKIRILRNGDKSYIIIKEIDCATLGLTNNNTYTLSLFNNRANINDSFTISNIMLNEGSVALQYQPYEGKTIHEKDLENTKNEINNAKQDKLVNEINIKSINGNSILGSGSLNIVADGVYTKVTEGVNYYDLEWGKTYKIKMNSDSYAYCSAIPNIKFYGTFEITNFSIRYSDQGSGVGVVGPEYDYILSANGNRYLASQGQDVKRGASATTHSKPPIRLSAYGGSTFAVYLLN